MRARLLALEAWWLAPQPLHGLVAARIALGLTLFLAYLQQGPWLADFFGPEGLGGAALRSRVPDFPPLSPHLLAPFTALARTASPWPVPVLYACMLVASLAFAAGAFTRAAGAAALLLHLLFLGRDPLVWGGGWAEFVVAPLLYAVLAPSGRHLSIDAWRRGGDASWWAPGWPLRLMQLHVCALYVVAAWSRLDRESWLHGDLLFAALSSATHSRLVFDWAAWQPLLRAATYVAWALELAAPVALWLRRTRRAWALALLGLHAGIELTTNVGWWNAVVAASLCAFLLPWRRAGDPSPPRP